VWPTLATAQVQGLHDTACIRRASRMARYVPSRLSVAIVAAPTVRESGSTLPCSWTSSVGPSWPGWRCYPHFPSLSAAYATQVPGQGTQGPSLHIPSSSLPGNAPLHSPLLSGDDITHFQSWRSFRTCPSESRGSCQGGRPVQCRAEYGADEVQNWAEYLTFTLHSGWLSYVLISCHDHQHDVPLWNFHLILLPPSHAFSLTHFYHHLCLLFSVLSHTYLA
jgi:hypothetical protein